MSIHISFYSFHRHIVFQYGNAKLEYTSSEISWFSKYEIVVEMYYSITLMKVDKFIVVMLKPS